MNIHRLHSFTSIDGHLGGFHVPATVNNAARNVGAQKSFQYPVCMPRRGPSGSHGRFHSLRNPHAIHSGWTSSHSHKRTEALFPPDPCRQPSGRCEVTPHCDVGVMSPVISDTESLPCSCWPFACLLWKPSSQHLRCLFLSQTAAGFVAVAAVTEL